MPRSAFVPSCFLALLACLACLLLLRPGQAQDAKGKKSAVLVGVRQYRHSALGPLKGTENDVEELAKVLLEPSCGYSSVRILTTTRGEKNPDDAPTAKNIRDALEDLRARKGRNDTVLIAFSGHGGEVKVSDPDPESKKEAKSYSYFFPADADFEKISYSTGKSNWLIGLDDLLEQLGTCGAGAKLVLIDACRNEMKATSSTKDLSFTKATLPRGVAALFSCGVGQKSFETEFDLKDDKKIWHGVFFYHVLEGLKGKARNSDGTVNWDDLSSHVIRRVPPIVKIRFDRAEQEPHGLKNLPKETVLVSPAEAKVVKGAREYTNDFGGMKLVRIPGGTFTMGSLKKEQDDAIADYEKDGSKASDRIVSFYRAEGPQHDVQVSEFYLGVHEVTQKQFRAVMSYNPSYFSKNAEGKAGEKYSLEPGGGKAKIPAGEDTENYPVENVSWDEAVEFCKKLNEKDKKNMPSGYLYRLPTEAEWEYACRGGPPSYQVFHFGNSLSYKQANFDWRHPFGGGDKKADDSKSTCKVGNYDVNRFGLYDMHGNVAEWCADWYAADYYGKSKAADPPGPSEGSSRVVRGGGWGDFGQGCRSAGRYGNAPEDRFLYLGFRVALVPSGR